MITKDTTKKGFRDGVNSLVNAPAITYYRNVYVDLNGHIRPKKLPTEGLWFFDGQFFYKPKVK